MHIRNKRDFWSGMLFIATGLLFAVLSQQYQMGTASRMGPGWFPTALGIILVILGAITLTGSLSKSAGEAELEPVGWREIGLILGAVALFAGLLTHLGMVLSATILILIAAIASHEFRLKETLISIAVLLVMSYLVFAKGLELQFPVWPTFLGGGA